MPLRLLTCNQPTGLCNSRSATVGDDGDFGGPGWHHRSGCWGDSGGKETVTWRKSPEHSSSPSVGQHDRARLGYDSGVGDMDVSGGFPRPGGHQNHEYRPGSHADRRRRRHVVIVIACDDLGAAQPNFGPGVAAGGRWAGRLLTVDCSFGASDSPSPTPSPVPSTSTVRSR